MNLEKISPEDHAPEALSIKSRLLRGLAKIGLRRTVGADAPISSQEEGEIKLRVHYSGHDTHDDFKKVGEYIDNPDTRPDVYYVRVFSEPLRGLSIFRSYKKYSTGSFTQIICVLILPMVQRHEV